MRVYDRSTRAPMVPNRKTNKQTIGYASLVREIATRAIKIQLYLHVLLDYIRPLFAVALCNNVTGMQLRLSHTHTINQSMLHSPHIKKAASGADRVQKNGDLPPSVELVKPTAR